MIRAPHVDPGHVRSSGRAMAFAGRLAVALAALLLAPPACSLGNVGRDACDDDAGCAAAFGVGSTCSDGYCSEAGSCTTGHDCRMKYGGGACVEGTCRMFVPANAQCSLVDPPELLTERPLAGDGSTLVIGAIFATDDPKNLATADAVILAAREIDESTGLANGQRVGVVVCDNGGPGNAATGEERTLLDQQALDYLAGTLGVPFLVGPRTSSDALKIVARLVEKKYPTVVISPSATSPELTGVPSRIDPSDPHPLFWRTCPSDARQAAVLSNDVIKADATIATATVVYTNDAYGQGFSDVFLDAFGVGQTSLVPFDPSKIPTGEAEIVAQNAARANADAIVIITTSGSDTIEILGAMAAAGLGTKKFFFTDGSKDAAKLLAADVPEPVRQIVLASKGTAPAPARDAKTFAQFSAGLGAEFTGLDPSQFSFIAHAYDAAYIGALGTVYAATKSEEYDGRQVAAGIARLRMGEEVAIGPVSWPSAKQAMADDQQIDVLGISGELDLDPKVGEGPALIEVWKVAADGESFETDQLL